MKTAIIFYSEHHGNTKKLLDAIVKENEVTLIDVTAIKNFDLTEYDVIGFASGIYFSKFNKALLKFANNNLPDRKKVFAIYTCGKNNANFADCVKEIFTAKNAELLGVYNCPGYDTYGPLKLIGGLNKNRPDENDISGATEFYKKITSEKTGE